MPAVNEKTLATCIQALQKAIRFNELVSQSDTVDGDDYEESSYMFELELSKLCDIYKEEELKGNISIPLSSLLKAPFDELKANK